MIEPGASHLPLVCQYPPSFLNDWPLFIFKRKTKMAKGRLLKTNISDSDKLAIASNDSVRLVWTWMLAFLDIEGRTTADLDLVKGKIFPKIKSMTKNKIWKCLWELNELDLIILYGIKKKGIFIQFQGFHEHQSLRKNREGESKIPPCVKGSRITPGPLQEYSALSLSLSLSLSSSLSLSTKAIEHKWEGLFQEFWEAYDYKVKIQDARNAFFTLLRKKIPIEDIRKAVNGYHAFLDYKKNEKNFDQEKMYPSSFLRSDRWKDYLKFKKKAPL